MSDRYTRLYTLQNGDYIHQEDNCPVFCCAGSGSVEVTGKVDVIVSKVN